MALDLSKIAKGGWTPRLSYVIGLSMAVALEGAVYQYLMTGKAPRSRHDLTHPQTGGSGLRARGGQPPERMRRPISAAADVGVSVARSRTQAGHPVASSICRQLGQHWVCFEVTVERRPGDIEPPADVFDRGSALVVELFGKGDLAGSAGKPRPTAFASAGTGSSEACLGALPDDVALELRESSKDVEDELSAGGRGVDLLGEASEAYPFVVEGGDCLDEVPEGASETVETPDDQNVSVSELG